MNILFYLTRFPGFGGIETVTEVVGCELLKRGHTITILTHKAQERPSQLASNCPIHVFPQDKLYYCKKNVQFAESIVEGIVYDAIIYQDSYAPSEKIVCHLSHKYNIPLYVFEHNTPLNLVQSRKMHRCSNIPLMLWRKFCSYPMEDRKYRRRRRLLLDTCTKYVLLSKYFKDDLLCVMDGDVDTNKLAYINNPIEYKPLESSKLVEKENIVLCVCRLESVKRVNLMLDMWKKIGVKDWRFVILGDGTQRKLLEEKVSTENITNVEFVGYTDPQNFYEKAKVFWMTSQFEGWALTLIEAMQKGCVPIAYDTFSSVHDVISSSDVGFVVDNLDESGFIGKSLLLMTDRSLYETKANNGINYAAKYNVNNIVNEWIALINIE